MGAGARICLGNYFADDLQCRCPTSVGQVVRQHRIGNCVALAGCAQWEWAALRGRDPSLGM